MIKGLHLSEMFYIDRGKDMIKKEFPELEHRIAVGLVGEGSECLGFDDEISKDHDYGPSFCLWMTDDDYERYHEKVTVAFQQLPALYDGMKTRLTPEETLGRTGVMKTSTFYKNILQIDDIPQSNTDWLKIDETRLATAVNGKVFRDDLGEFSKIRNLLINYYPDDVLLKRLAAALALAAQSGQYNYVRCLSRTDSAAAYLMMASFVQNCLKVIFLLNRKYHPFDKWAFKSMETLPELKNAQAKLKKLVSKPASEYEKVMMIESICADIANMLRAKGLSSSDDDFLMPHAVEVTRKIKDIELLKMNILSEKI